VGYYKDLNIVQDFDIIAEKRKISTILGANGVGRSTMLKAIFGFLKPNAGEILLNAESILDTPTYRRIQRGLTYIPQQPGVFHHMSVEENLALGAWTFQHDKKTPHGKDVTA
jgi:branched-chain amino acid transport system ATP-binding protein